MRSARRQHLLLVASILALASSARADVVFAWGNGASGKLAQGGTDVASRLTPTKTVLPNTIVSIAAGASTGYALDLSGVVYGWGGNVSKQLADGSPTNTFDFTAHPTPVVLANVGGNVVEIASMSGTGMVRKSDGSLWLWGVGNQSQLIGLTAGAGTVASIPIQGVASGVTRIDGGSAAGYMIVGGQLQTWGWGGTGQLGNGSTNSSNVPLPNGVLNSGVTAVAGGTTYGLAIKDGAVYSFGSNTLGQLGNGTFVSPSPPSGPAPVVGLPVGVTQIAAGSIHSLALANNTVYAWGDNRYGQIGDGTTTTGANATGVNTPVAITGITGNIVQIAAGSYSSYALTDTGSLWVWGNNTAGQLGLGDTANRLVPTLLASPAGYKFTSLAATTPAANQQVTSEFAYATAVEVPFKYIVDADGNYGTASNFDGNLVPTGVNGRVLFGAAISSPRTVTVDVDVSLSWLVFDNAAASYTLAGANSITLIDRGPGSIVTVASGAHRVTTLVTLTATQNSIDVAAASSLELSGTVTGSSSTIAKSGPGTLTLSRGSIGSLAVSNGKVAIGGTSVLVTQSLSLATTSQLDLGAGAIAVDYSGASPLASLLADVQSGRIGSSARTGSQYAIGYIDTAASGGARTFRGESIDASTVLLAQTLRGDTNLDGLVNFDDLLVLASNYNQSGGVRWYNGDFNGDQSVNFDDLLRLAANYNSSYAGTMSLGGGAGLLLASGGASSVPEPTTGVLLGLVAVGALRRRTRVVVAKSNDRHEGQGSR